MARDDDVINVAGHRLSTSAIEEVLLTHPGVGDAAVVGVAGVIGVALPLVVLLRKTTVGPHICALRKYEVGAGKRTRTSDQLLTKQSLLAF